MNGEWTHGRCNQGLMRGVHKYTQWITELCRDAANQWSWTTGSHTESASTALADTQTQVSSGDVHMHDVVYPKLACSLS